MAVLDEREWDSQYELMFSLRLERAECEFLTGNFERAEQLIAELLARGASKFDQAAVYHSKVLLHTVKSENTQAVDSALTCLRLFDIDIPAHPTWEQVHAEYRDGLADPRWAADRELDRSAVDDGSGSAGAAMRVLSTLLTCRLRYRS